MKMWLAVWLGWGLLVWITLAPATFAWLIGPGSLLATLLPGTQHFMGFEGIEGVWFVATLPVLLVVIRRQQP